MRILYSAIDQTVPGTKGGSVHVTAVAEGLAALGHEVHALVTPGPGFDRLQAGAGPAEAGRYGVRWRALAPPFGARQLRWTRAGHVRRLVEALRPDIIIERYYNFGGEAIRAAAAVGATAVLEVNAPVVDYPGSGKAIVDRALVVRPMRRWREQLCARSALIVTPSAGILPESTPRARILELEWGADTDRFHPDVREAVPFLRPAGTVAIFAGAFRSWHGAIHLVDAIRDLHERGRRDIAAVLVGDGPELPAVRAAAGGNPRIVFTGAVPHQLMPACLAAADIGVAPFDLGAHAPLALGFYWSPLKVFEYMAAGLPVVVPAVDRLPSLIGRDREGVLYDPSAAGALAAALERLTDPALRQRLGSAARDRAVREYSWKAHCQALDDAFRAARAAVRR